ncbi:MAG TPA: DNA adenine methylase [Spirochaetia bacterium]|nr:DNA adenine methylase [Spirochaetia bacterium]
MGSKQKLLPWIHEVLSEFRFRSVLDGFSGSGCVSYMLKVMGKKVTANDFLTFCKTVAHATVENGVVRILPKDLDLILRKDRHAPRFIQRTFDGIFFASSDLRFLDRVSWNTKKLLNPYSRSLVMAALIRSCVKRQPRGVFTVAGDPQKYKDGRRDVMLSIEEHFREQIEIYNSTVFDNGCENRALQGSIFEVPRIGHDYDLVYLDPPYVPRSDDNCYIKRYHFLEGLACYWEGQEILEQSKVKKIRKKYTPFSYRSDALSAFEQLFLSFRRSTLVLSYSSNGFPDLDYLVTLMKKVKKGVKVFEKDHRYHFGTHSAVKRSVATEYLIVGHE